MWLNDEADPAIVHRQQVLAMVEVDGDSTTAEQQQWIHRHHGAVADVHLSQKSYWRLSAYSPNLAIGYQNAQHLSHLKLNNVIFQ